MTLDQFRLATDIMFDGFGTYNKEARRKAYYELFYHETVGDVEKAAMYAAKQLDNFPTPRQFLNVLNIVKAQKPSGKKVECSLCGGSGHLSAKDAMDAIWAYRCHCSNGAKYKNWPQWAGQEGKWLYGNPGDKLEDDCPF